VRKTPIIQKNNLLHEFTIPYFLNEHIFSNKERFVPTNFGSVYYNNETIYFLIKLHIKFNLVDFTTFYQ
jgi:hypothetical protein